MPDRTYRTSELDPAVSPMWKRKSDGSLWTIWRSSNGHRSSSNGHVYGRPLGDYYQWINDQMPDDVWLPCVVTTPEFPQPVRERRPLRLCRVSLGGDREAETVYQVGHGFWVDCSGQGAIKVALTEDDVICWHTPEFTDEPIGERTLESKIFEAMGRIAFTASKSCPASLWQRFKSGEHTPELLTEIERMAKEIQSP